MFFSEIGVHRVLDEVILIIFYIGDYISSNLILLHQVLYQHILPMFLKNIKLVFEVDWVFFSPFLRWGRIWLF